MGFLPPILNREGQSPVRRSLRRTLMGWFLVLALLPLLVAGGIGYHEARQARREDVRHLLQGGAVAARHGLQELFQRATRELEHQARLAANRDLLSDLVQDLAASGQPSRVWARSQPWLGLEGTAGAELVRYRNASPWHDVKVFDSADLLLFSCREEDDLGTCFEDGAYARTHLADALRRCRQTQQIVLSSFAAYGPSGDLVSAFLVAPLDYGPGGDGGLMALQISAETLAERLQPFPRGGDYLEVYLLNEMLQPVAMAPGSAGVDLLATRILTDATVGWLELTTAPAVTKPIELSGAFFDPIAPGVYEGTRGEPVFGRCVSIDLVQRHFGLVVEVPTAQAMAGLWEIRLLLLMLIVGAVVMVVVMGHLVSRRVVKPIIDLGAIMDRVADGREVRSMDVVGHNEVGDLADKFAFMISHLDEAKRLRDHQFRLQRSQFELNERMRGEPDTEALAGAILEFIGDYYRAHMGAFYLARPGQQLVLAAEFGAGGGPWPAQELREGQGVVGRAALRHRVEVLRDLPPDHAVSIDSGLGTSAPRTLIVAPFHLAGQLKGIIELALIGSVSEEDLEFLRLSAEAVAVALDSSRSRERVHRLLEETRRQAGTMARQQRELQDKNECLARSDRYKSEFLANMSHELRTPLNSMMLMAQVLRENRDSRLSAGEVEAAGTIHHAGEELLTIIDDILDLSKVEAGKLELHHDDVDVTRLAVELDHLFRPLADRKGLEFHCRVAEGVPGLVLTDGLRLKQILKNLLNNAFKFTEHGSVALEVGMTEVPEGGMDGDRASLLFEVADTGIGMDAETRAKVFEPFNQGDGTIGRRYGGSGLGLSISRRLTELLEGHLDLASSEGQGSRFVLTIPQVHSAALAPDRPDDQINELVPCDPVAALPPEQDPDPAPVVLGDDLADLQVLVCDQEMRTVYRLIEDLVGVGLRPRVVRRPETLLAELPQVAADTIVLVNPWPDPAEPDAPVGNDLLARLAASASTVALVALVPAGCTEDLPAADAVVPKPVLVSRVLDACRAAVARDEVTA